MFASVSLPVILALATSVDAFWRMPCRARSGLARIDPLVAPGSVSEHAHAIHGGSAFSSTSTYDDLRNSQCTSCGVKEDTSAYWTAPLYFQHKDGTVELVPQVGGMLAYYLLYGQDIKAFPPGFRLIAGDTRLRNFSWPIPDPPKSSWSGDQAQQPALAQKAIGFNCLNYGKAPEGSLYRHVFPDKNFLDANCVDGIRAELMFPSCWNGKLDAADHKSHMAYPSLVIDGTCPPGFDKRTPSLFYETIWDTYKFKGVDGQFVFGNGDPTGCGYHGDFMTGWDEGILQKAVDTCKNNGPNGEDRGMVEDCSVFTLQSDADAAKCNFKMPTKLVAEDCAGPREGLPGDVPIQYGPNYAAPLGGGYNAVPPMSAAPAAPSAAPTYSYRPGSIIVTNSGGGGGDITVANIPTNYIAPPAPAPSSNTAQPSPAAQDVAVAAAPPPAQVTTAPSIADAATAGHKILSTSYYTSNGIAYEVAIEEVDVTVTSTVTNFQKHKRHIHHNRRRAHNYGYDF